MKDYVLTLLVAAAVTYMLTPLVRRFAVRVGAMHEARDRDVHVVPIPRLGGLAMFGGLAAGLLVAYQIPPLRNAFAGTGMVSGLLLAGGLLIVIGFIDDRWGLSAVTKLAGQIAAGAILVATGTQLSWLPEPGGGTFIPTTNQQALLTILVVVATINAVNFIDGLDGLATGIVAIAAISFFLYYYSLTKVINISSLAAPALASAILIGMCLGFLPHNFSPAKIFMGDTGSMLLGLLLAYAPISSISSLDYALLTRNPINRYPEIMPLLLPAALLVIPYADLLLAVVRRTRAGTSPFAPDRKHLHHRLLDIGHSQRSSVLIMYLWAALFSGSIVWLSLQRTTRAGSANHHGQPVLVFVAITVAAVAALLLMSMPRLRWWGRRAAGRRAATASPAPSAAPAEAARAGAARLAAPVTAEPELATVAAAAATLAASVGPVAPVAPAPPVTPAPTQQPRIGSDRAPATLPDPPRSGAALLSSGWSDADLAPSARHPTAPARSIIGTVPPASSWAWPASQDQAVDYLGQPVDYQGEPTVHPGQPVDYSGQRSGPGQADAAERAAQEQPGPLPRRIPPPNGRAEPLPRRTPTGPAGPTAERSESAAPLPVIDRAGQDREGPGSEA